MKKKPLITLMASVLALSYTAAVLSITVLNNPHVEESHADGAHEHDDILFDQAWTSDNSLPTEAGNYYLTTDVTMTGRWFVRENISLCLNGHVITATYDACKYGYLIDLQTNNYFDPAITFNFCDCGTAEHKAVWENSDQKRLIVNDSAESEVVTTFTGGYVTGSLSGDIFRISRSELNMYGGTLIGNLGENGEYDYIMSRSVINGEEKSSINMYGGNILGNAQFGITANSIVTSNPEDLSSCNIYGGRISYNAEGGIVVGKLKNGLTLQNVEISHNKGDLGGGVQVNGDLTINSGTLIKDNSASTRGGGVAVLTYENATVTIEGGEISNNSSAGTGGGVDISASSSQEGTVQVNMTGGVIKNNSAIHGAGIYASSEETFAVELNVSGGQILNNTASSFYDHGYLVDAGSGGGIEIKGGEEPLGSTLNISGGEIKNNVAPTGGGVAVRPNTNFTLSGNPVISGNKNEENQDDEIYLEGPQFSFESEYEPAVITVPGTIDEDISFGVRMASPGIFTKGLEDGNDYISHFYSCDDTYTVFVDSTSKQLMLDIAHTHNLSYSASGATITATCDAVDCPLPNNTATLTLLAPSGSLVYDENPKVASLQAGYNPGVFGTPTITYEGPTTNGECINAGTYTAKVTVGGATAQVEFTIAKADPTPAAVSDKNATYGQSLSEIALPEGWSWNSSTDKVGNVGTNQHAATFTPEDVDNYNVVQQDVNVIVAKANPTYTVPTGLTSSQNKTLSTVSLPAGWSWADPTENVGSTLGNKTFKATFTPADTDNYNIVENIDVVVQVTHEHDWSFSASGATITATCGNPECSVDTGLTLTLKAPSGSLVYDGNPKTASLEEGYNASIFGTPSISYEGPTTNGQCINVGTYTAKITVINRTAQVEFSITKADPEYLLPEGLTSPQNQTLSSISLPDGWEWDDENQNVGSTLGEQTFKASFTPEDTSNYNKVEHIDVTVEVIHVHDWSYVASGASITASCGNPNCSVDSGLVLTLNAPSGSLIYDGTAKVASLEAGYDQTIFGTPEIVYVGPTTNGQCINAGTYTAKVTVGGETAQIEFTIAKANPTPNVPTGLTSLKDKTLSTIELPTGWAWDDETQSVGSELGEHTFKATFTPEDTDNYNKVEHVDITVTVVAHQHNWTYSASGATITASCDTPECPVTSGLTLTLLAPTGDMVYDGNTRVATIQAGYSEIAFPNAQIKYYKDSAEVSECKDVGVYTAKVTFGNATASVSFEILGKTVVDPNNSDVEIEFDNAVEPAGTTLMLRVEVRTDVAEKDVAADYAKIKQQLAADEQISKVYDVKLIQIDGEGVETEIQPSDIKPGLQITVKMAIPQGMNMSEVRILHIHSVNDMEFVTNYEISGNDLVFKIDRLSQFAFITKVNTPVSPTEPAKGGLPGWVIPVSIVGGVILLFLLLFLFLFLFGAKYIVYTETYDEPKVKKVIKLGKSKDDDSVYVLYTFSFKKLFRVKEEIFSKKKDAEEFLKSKVNSKE